MIHESNTGSEHNLIVVLGATATGKTKLAVDLANRLSGEIISADSRQVFRGLDIGSGKDLGDYGTTPYYLIDILDPGQEFNVFLFQEYFFKIFDELRGRKTLPILSGGTGMYIESVLQGYRMVHAPENIALREELITLDDDAIRNKLRLLKPKAHNTTDLVERARIIRAIEIAVAEEAYNLEAPSLPNLNPVVLGLQWPRDQLRKRITQRLKTRLDQGMIEEVDGLHKGGVAWETLNYYGLEYKFVASYLQGQINKNDMFQKLNSAIHQFAKRQETWFRKMERKGAEIHWIDGQSEPSEKLDIALQHYHETS